MAQTPQQTDGLADWPSPPGEGRDVVLHTRVVTETGGGPDKTILLSAPFLSHTNYWLASAYMHPADEPGFDAIRRRAEAWGSPLISVPDGGPLDRRPLRKLLDICRHYNVKVWHGHDYKSNLFGLLLRPFWPMKLVTTVHGWVKQTSRTPLYYTIDRWSLPFYHHIVTVSDDLYERILQLRVPEERVTLIHNAIDERTFTRSGPAAQGAMRRDVGTPEGRLVFGAVGRLSPEKAFNNLLHAAHQLVQQGVDLEVWIAGDGDARADLEKLTAALDMTDRVRLLGFVKDTIALYESMDVFVLSSLREGLPNVVLEAASMRVPIVSTRVAGVPKMLTDGEDGLLVPIGEIEPLRDAMGRLARDPALREQFAAAGRQLIEREYSFANRMEKVRAIYDRVLGTPQRVESRPGVEAQA